MRRRPPPSPPAAPTPPAPPRPARAARPATLAQVILLRAALAHERLALGPGLRQRARLPGLLRLHTRLHALPAAVLAATLLPLLVACATGTATGGAPAANQPAPAPAAASGNANSPSSAPAATPVKLRTAYTTVSASQVPLLLTGDVGLFAEQGIDAEVLHVPPGQALLGALSTREVPIVIAGASQAIEASLQGGDYLILGAVQPSLTNSIYVAADIRRPEDLRGKSIGVSNFGAISHVALRVALEHWGLDEGRDVTAVRSGGTPETLAAMQSGAIAGGSFSPPQTYRAEELGFHELYDVSTSGVDLGSAAVVSTRGYVRDQAPLIDRYFRALAKGVLRFRDDREAAVAAIMKQAQTDDRRLAERTWEYYRNKLTPDLAVTERMIANNLRMMADQRPEALQARPETFMDPSYFERLKSSGYLDELQRGS